MPSSTLSAITGLAIAGAGLGLYLGKSAVSEINPAYFSDPVSSSRFHADLAASPPSLDGIALPPERASAMIGLGSNCVGCRTYPEEYIPIHDPAVERYDSYAAVPSAAERILADAEKYVAQGPSREEFEQVQRYAHYRVASNEKPAMTILPDPTEVAAPTETYAGTGGPEEADIEVETETAPAV